MLTKRLFGPAITQSLIATVSMAQQSSDLVSGVPVNPEREAYFGDLHLHTTYSYDVYLSSNITPEEAYRFARGEPVNYIDGTIKRTTLPLDFLAVTDHSESIGVFNTLDDPKSQLSQSGFGREVFREGMKVAGRAFVRLWEGGMHKRLSSVADVQRETVDTIARGAWQRTIEAANRHYQPGRFTTFIGYEWTSEPGMRNLHRNVIYRGDKAPNPFTSEDSSKPEDLWNFLEGIRRQGYDALAIPHNANASDGLMFSRMDSRGMPIDQAYADRRAANEPLVEIVQRKGQSETHPVLSPTDEFSSFELMDFMKPFRIDRSSKLSGSYVRDALGRGMEIAKNAGGANPFKYGFVGGSDIHTGLSDSSENAQAESMNVYSLPPRTDRSKAFGNAAVEQMGVSFPSIREESLTRYGVGSSGLTGVWAEQNTRESIFAALRRKETFATSGTRLKFRFFGSWDYSTNLFKSAEWVKAAYRGGVPMGGDLPAQPSEARSPTFALWAVKDPNGANLDRLQVVKIWLGNGRHMEAVYNVALSDGRTVDPTTDKAPAVGNTVNLQTATYTNTIGATELSSVWQDPHFDTATPAVYYLRVLEIPTPRYSTILAVNRGQALPNGIPTIQERGWSSPIWYTPPRNLAARISSKSGRVGRSR